MPISNSPDQVVLATVTAAVATSTGLSEVAVPRCINGCIFTLDLTAAATAVGDTLNVYVQALLGSGMWVDCVAFTQILGNGAQTKRYIAKVGTGTAETMFETGTALSAGSVRNLLGDKFRVRYAIVSSSAPSFSFTVTAQPV